MWKKRDVRVFEHSFQSLHEATVLADEEVCRFLLKFGVSIDAPNDQRKTALMLASEHGHRELVALFLRYDASLNEFDEEGLTALMLAACNGHTSIVKLLLAAGADASQRNDRGETALAMAQRYGQFAAAAELSENKRSSWFDVLSAWYSFARSVWNR